ncbi:LysR family transcriptional regulator [Clostridium sp. 'White wine YQ']|uniref:LysR family transcriptional regulator n=1 Tax=Clostridium sp. 'White wine YQ' TaxID=3027474 RepID=UPI00236508D5|nr:LysR family transcriptional regulator [Clostridium sp. 'White wine YQ']MDD7793366.1 LysR family transcriptional regulator [Clostridium sp. 'White wine YQ']
MESNELRIFKTVALEGSITKAAQILGYVQSNITARIQQLESELKTPLFYRQRGMVLTPAGEKLLVYAEQILHLIEDAEKALDDSINPSGSLAIGANHTLSSLHLPAILSKYHKTYPKVDLSLITGNTNELIYKVQHFQIDGAFVKSSAIPDENIIKELAYEENLVLISSSKYNDIQEVCYKPFIMNTVGCPNRFQLEEWLRSKGIFNIRYMEFNNLDSIIEGVVEDLGASFVPESSIEEYEKLGLIKSFKIPQEYSLAKTFFIRHRDSLKTNALQKFIEIIESKTSFHSIINSNYNSLKTLT